MKASRIRKDGHRDRRFGQRFRSTGSDDADIGCIPYLGSFIGMIAGAYGGCHALTREPEPIVGLFAAVVGIPLGALGAVLILGVAGLCAWAWSSTSSAGGKAALGSLPLPRSP